MKKIIRLTESDLHSLISEAVKTALNELDPRTYASAATKAINKRDPRGSKFYRKAIDSWNDEYGGDISTNDEKGNSHSFHGDMDTLEWFATNHNLQGDDYSYSERISGGNKLPTYSDGYESLKSTKEKSPFYDRYLKGKEVARQMRDGSGSYSKEKGWD